MKISYKLSIILFCVVLIYSCKLWVQTTNNASANKLPDKLFFDKIDSLDVEDRLNMFAFNIYRKCAKQQNDNMLISPLSISTAMAMAYGGSDGKTKGQMSNTLFFDYNMNRFHADFAEHIDMIENQAEDDLELNIINGMWLQHDYMFLETYIETIIEHYGSVLHEADFVNDHEEVRSEINEWVSENTNNKIEELIHDNALTEDTRMVLVNAIYFLSKWLHEFDEELTHERKFYPVKEKDIKAPFMEKETDFYYCEDKYAQVIEILYSGKNFSMIIILPKEDVDFSSFEKKLDFELFGKYLANLESRSVRLLLPKFKMRYHIDLEELFKQMGMPLVFSDYADLSRMTKQDNLKIDKVIHQAFVEVDEQGTEAAAATAISIGLKSAAPDDDLIIFEANRPFKFFIKENKSNTILFMGRMMNPTD